MKTISIALILLQGGLCGCQFSGSTALPPLPGLEVETPSGYMIRADSNLKGSLNFKDGDGKEIVVKLTQDVEGVVNAQATLAQGLEGLAKIESERQKVMWQSLSVIFDKLLEKLTPVPTPMGAATPVDGTGPVVGPPPN